MRGNLIRHVLLIASASLLLCHFVFAQNSPPPEIPIEQWLQGPERHDFDWKVQVVGPWLNFQQRHVAEVHGRLTGNKLIRAGISLSDLHFVVKVAGEDGRWFPGQDYTRYAQPPSVVKVNAVLFYARFYVRPGKYKVAVIAYDTKNKRGNLWRGQLQVPALNGDPIPGMARNLPQVEFPQQPEVEADKNNVPGPPSADRPADETPKLFLPVSNTVPVQVDVVANLSLSAAMNTYHSQAPEWLYRTNAGLLLQISKVLSNVDLKNGCVRFSAIDILRQTLFADRVPATEIDWKKLAGQVESVQQRKVDVHVLEREKITPAIFANFLEKLASGSPSCGKSLPATRHVVIVVSDAFLFPLKTQMTAVRPEFFAGSHCYYLQLNPVAGATWDQMGQVLRPLHPTRFQFSSPMQFRKILAQLMAAFEAGPKDAQSAP